MILPILNIFPRNGWPFSRLIIATGGTERNIKPVGLLNDAVGGLRGLNSLSRLRLNTALLLRSLSNQYL